MRLTSPHSNITIARLLAPALVSLVLALAAACGGGDSTSSTSSTPTSVVSVGATASPASGSSTPQASGAGSFTPGPTAVECTTAAPDAGLITQVYFAAGNVYTAGQAIDITLLLADCATNDAVLYFPTTQRYDFIIADANGVEAWRSSDGKSFGQVTGTETLHPGQRATYTETWDQKDRSRNQVAAGRYKVSALSVGCSVAARSGCQFGPIGYVQIQAAPGT